VIKLEYTRLNKVKKQLKQTSKTSNTSFTGEAMSRIKNRTNVETTIDEKRESQLPKNLAANKFN